jgi:hypothetical protein
VRSGDSAGCQILPFSEPRKGDFALRLATTGVAASGAYVRLLSSNSFLFLLPCRLCQPKAMPPGTFPPASWHWLDTVAGMEGTGILENLDPLTRLLPDCEPGRNLKFLWG